LKRAGAVRSKAQDDVATMGMASAARARTGTSKFRFMLFSPFGRVVSVVCPIGRPIRRGVYRNCGFFVENQLCSILSRQPVLSIKFINNLKNNDLTI
jgi:hypothetical protein